MKNPEFTADEPFTHINNLYYVYNSSGSKVGEIYTKNRSCSGDVSNYEACVAIVKPMLSAILRCVLYLEVEGNRNVL